MRPYGPIFLTLVPNGVRCGRPGLEATSRTFRRAYRPPNGLKSNYDDLAGLDGPGHPCRLVGFFSDTSGTAIVAIRTPTDRMDSRIQDLPSRPCPLGGPARR